MVGWVAGGGSTGTDGFHSTACAGNGPRPRLVPPRAPPVRTKSALSSEVCSSIASVGFSLREPKTRAHTESVRIQHPCETDTGTRAAPVFLFSLFFLLGSIT